MVSDAVTNMRITGTMLGTEDHGCLTFSLGLEGDGCGVGFGGYALDEYVKAKNRRVGTAFGTEAILAVMRTVGVSRWEDLKGKYVRVRWKDAGLVGSTVRSIGNIIEDKWLDIEALAEEARDAR